MGKKLNLMGIVLLLLTIAADTACALVTGITILSQTHTVSGVAGEPGPPRSQDSYSFTSSTPVSGSVSGFGYQTPGPIGFQEYNVSSSAGDSSVHSDTLIGGAWAVGRAMFFYLIALGARRLTLEFTGEYRYRFLRLAAQMQGFGSDLNKVGLPQYDLFVKT